MIEPIAPNEMPPGGWRWIHPETGHVVAAHTFHELVVTARRFLGNNNFPVPKELDQIILNWMDEQIQEDVAKRGLPPYPFLKTNESVTAANMARAFVYAATQWAKSGFKHVSQAQYEQRLNSCQTCGFWRGESALGYGSCGKCGCTALKLFMATTRCPLEPPRWGPVA